MEVKQMPDGYHTVTPYLHVDDISKLIQSLERAFQAREFERLPGQDCRIMHAEERIGDSIILEGK